MDQEAEGFDEAVALALAVMRGLALLDTLHPGKGRSAKQWPAAGRNWSMPSRRCTRLGRMPGRSCAARAALAAIAALTATLAFGAQGASAADPTVVLVSGLSSSTAFTNPDPACQGKEGRPWSLADGRNLSSPRPGGLLHGAGRSRVARRRLRAARRLPSSMTIDSGGDVDANGARLVEFLKFLQANYGVTKVRAGGALGRRDWWQLQR